MKASPIMFFEYLGMLGVPVLLMLVALFALLSLNGLIETILLALIGAGSFVYGLIAVREVFIHGTSTRRGSRREAP